MANGVLQGSGTAIDPWLIEDAKDLNQLRNMGAGSTSDYRHIKIVNDIDLSEYAMWSQINNFYININGNNKKIYNLNTQSGLFGNMYIQFINDLTIEGRIVSNGNCGLLAASIQLNAGSGISNVQCFGVVENTYNSTVSTGGVVGVVSATNANTGIVRNCTFKGIIKITNSGTNTNFTSGSTYGHAIGGVIGVANAYGGTSSTGTQIIVENCSSVYTIFVNLHTGAFIHGGICGLMNGGTSSSTPRPVHIRQCIAKIKAIANNIAAQTTLIHRVNGICGGSYESINTIRQCGAHIDIVWNGDFAVNEFTTNGIMSLGTANILEECYAVIRYSNPRGVDDSFVYFGGIGGGTGTRCFFDLEEFRNTTTKTIANLAMGKTTAELKSQAFLLSQGWDI